MTQYVLALMLGFLFAMGTYLVLREDVVRVVWGVSIISQAANVYLVTMGGLSGGVPILAHGHGGGGAVTDPLVQALVLTAIVIGFGTTAFALALTYRVYQAHGTIDVTELEDVLEPVTPATDAGGDATDGAATDGGPTIRDDPATDGGSDPTDHDPTTDGGRDDGGEAS